MRGLLNPRNKDYLGGGLMAVIGLAAMLDGLTYNVGTLARMGPGFFPVALGTILALIGIAIAFKGRFTVQTDAVKSLPPEWRGWFCIALGIVAFVVLGRYGGLLPASFAIVFISALGDRRNTIKNALTLALAIIAVCIVIFWWALQLQFPLFSWG